MVQSRSSFILSFPLFSLHIFSAFKFQPWHQNGQDDIYFHDSQISTNNFELIISFRCTRLDFFLKYLKWWCSLFLVQQLFSSIQRPLFEELFSPIPPWNTIHCNVKSSHMFLPYCCCTVKYQSCSSLARLQNQSIITEAQPSNNSPRCFSRRSVTKMRACRRSGCGSFRLRTRADKPAWPSPGKRFCCMSCLHSWAPNDILLNYSCICNYSLPFFAGEVLATLAGWIFVSLASGSAGAWYPVHSNHFYSIGKTIDQITAWLCFFV
jgi:hypothetical protein